MKSSHKIIGASAALGLAIALSAGSTFAWFTKGNTSVSVDSFDLSATATSDGANLEIAITDTEIATLGNNAFGPTATFGTGNKGGPSYEAALNALLAKELKPITYNTTQKNFADEEGNPTSDGYITFRIGFRSTSALKIYLDDTAAVTPSGAAKKTITGSEDDPVARDIIAGLGSGNYGATEGFTGTAGDACTITARAANAARVMFEEKKASATKYIWSPNEYYYNGGAVASDKAIGAAENEHVAGFWKGNLASDYVYAVSQMREEGLDFEEVDLQDSAYTPVAQATYSDCVKPASVEGKTLLATLVKPATLNAAIPDKTNYVSDSSDTYYYGVIDVTIWLEGTDGDCFDAILGDAMSIILAFKGEAE